MKKVQWEKLRRTEFEAAVSAGGAVIIPVVSVEQHANHLPINTDTNICYSIAKRSAETLDAFPVLVLPPVWMGYSPHHMQYPGSITLKYHTFAEVLSQIAVSVHTHGFKNIIFLNGHGGNSAVVAGLPTKLAAEENITVFGYDYWQLPSVPEEMQRICESDKGSIGHAGELETSFQLYLQPELVDHKAIKWAPGGKGDPTFGSSEKGERLFNVIVEALKSVLHDCHSGKLKENKEWRREIID